MKKFFYADGQNQLGPFTVEELLLKNISKDTLIWCEGLPDWTEAINIPELAEIFKKVPPPLPSNNLKSYSILQRIVQKTSNKIITSLWLIFTIALVILIGYVLYINSETSSSSLPTTLNSPETQYEENNQNNTIDAKSIALRKFDNYSPKIEASKDAAIGNSEAYSGDLNHDGLEDAIVFFVLTPKEGGNALIGQGFAVYINQGDDMKVVAGFEPDYIFRVEGISNNKIHIVRQDYTGVDDPGRPSIETHKYLILNGNKLQESNTF